MKPRGPYQIHALIGKCHLHYKKKASFSVTLKIGNKASASTQFKYPVDNEVNFNTQLILRVDRAYFQGPGKEQQRKILGSGVVQFRQKGMQSCKIAACSCKQKSIEVMVEFEVVNIQNQNNNQNNNKILSPNNPEMRDLKKTLTISREKELLKSSKIKPSTVIKAGNQKTQIKLNSKFKDKNFTDTLSPNISSLTTKIPSSQIKLQQQTKDSSYQLRNRIIQLESKLQISLNEENFHRKQVETLRNEIGILRQQNECLIEILKFQEEKSSAALSYIALIADEIEKELKGSKQWNQCFDILQEVKNKALTGTCSVIKFSKDSQLNQPLLPETQRQQKMQEFQKQQFNIENQRNEAILNQLQTYKQIIDQLKLKMTSFQQEENIKTQTISSLQQSVLELNRKNTELKKQLEKLKEQNLIYIQQIKSLNGSIQLLQAKLNTKELTLSQSLQNCRLLKQKISTEQDLKSQLYQQKYHLQNQLEKATLRINQLLTYHSKFQTLLFQPDNFKKQTPKTPSQSQIYTKKSKFEDAQELQIIMNEMNRQQQENVGRDLLLVSRQVSEKQQFLVRNKSESLLKDIENNLESQGPNTESTSKEINKETLTDEREYQNKIQLQVKIPLTNQQSKKYNYEYDIDSLNYFNNYDGHEAMANSGSEDNQNQT